MHAREALTIDRRLRVAALGLGLAVAFCAACSAPSGSPTSPTAATTVGRDAAGEDDGLGLMACEGGLLAATDESGEIEPVARGVIRTRHVTVDAAALKQRARAREPLVFNLFPDACVTAHAIEVLDLGPDALVWTGRPMDEMDGSLVTVVVDGDAVEASMRTVGPAFYQITYVGGGVHVVLQINPAVFPPD